MSGNHHFAGELTTNRTTGGWLSRGKPTAKTRNDARSGIRHQRLPPFRRDRTRHRARLRANSGAQALRAVLPLAGQLFLQVMELALQEFAVARTLRTLQLLLYASATQIKSLQFASAYCFFARDSFVFYFG